MVSTRRGFLSGLLSLPFLGAAGAKEAETVSPVDYVLEECYIAGFQYHQGPQVRGQLVAGTALRLVPEPDNPHDEQAVRIEFEGRHIGYIPRVRHQPLFRLLAQRAPVHCVVALADLEAVPWEAIRVRVSIEALPATV